ncbi:hypothetical protein GGI12_002151 [Dipsacomyces acuminosporus]|nr:hypothetical protein GGI12_002151 [Dipsacomyces acuminosporus]
MDTVAEVEILSAATVVLPPTKRRRTARVAEQTAKEEVESISSLNNSTTAGIDGDGVEGDNDGGYEGEKPSPSSMELLVTPASTPRSPKPRAKNYICAVCSRAFTRPCRLEEHERSHTGERPFKCMFPGCDKSYMRDTHLAVHARSHNQELKTKHRCTFEGCSRGFATSQKLKRHLKCHEVPRPFRCTFDGCSEAFDKKHKLHLHVCGHTGENPYKCDADGCQASFKYPSQLKRHKKTHSTDCTYICAHGGCAERFAKWSELQAHVKEAHKPEPHQCELCDATFKKRHALTLHLLRHDPNRPVHMCPYDGCGRFYLDLGSLNAHGKTVHESDGPRFACPHSKCGKRYMYAHTLNSHIAKCHQAGSSSPSAGKNSGAEAARRAGARASRLCQASILDIASGMAYSNPDISGRTLLCDVDGCQFRFKRPCELQTHLAAVHGISDLEAIDEIVARAKAA